MNFIGTKFNADEIVTIEIGLNTGKVRRIENPKGIIEEDDAIYITKDDEYHVFDKSSIQFVKIENIPF